MNETPALMHQPVSAAPNLVADIFGVILLYNKYLDFLVYFLRKQKEQ